MTGCDWDGCDGEATRCAYRLEDRFYMAVLDIHFCDKHPLCEKCGERADDKHVVIQRYLMSDVPHHFCGAGCCCLVPYTG